MAEINLGNLYDFNKELMKKEKIIDPIIFNTKVKQIAEDMFTKAFNNDEHYWMLLCHDRRDFTLFNIIAATEVNDIIEEIKPTLTNRGQIITIDKQPNGAWEIWIRDIETTENFVYYLFKYDNGVIEINS